MSRDNGKMNPPEPVAPACPNCAGMRYFSERLMVALENAQKQQAEALLRSFGIQQESKLKVYDKEHDRAVAVIEREREISRVVRAFGIEKIPDRDGYIDTRQGVQYDSIDEVLEDLGNRVGPELPEEREAP